MKYKIQQVAWIAGGQLVGLLCNFMLLKILTSNLSTTSFGYYALWMSITLFIRQILYDPVSIVAAKESIKINFLGKKELSGFCVINYLAKKTIIVSFLFIIIFSFINYKIERFNEIQLYIVAGIIYLFSNGIQGIYINILNAKKNRKLAAIGVGADSFIKVLLVGVSILIYGARIDVVILTITLSSFLVYYSLKYLIKKYYLLINLSASELAVTCKQLLIYSLPFLVPCLLIALKNSGDKWFMAAMLGLEELGAYNVLFQLGFVPMVLIIGVVQTYAAPEIYKLSVIKNKKQGDCLIKYVNMLLIKILVFIAFAIIASLFFSDIIFELLVGIEYAKYSTYLPFFVMAGSLAALSGLVHIAVIGVFQTMTVAWLMFIAVVFGLIVTGLLIRVFGFYGGVAGLIFSGSVSLLIFYIYLFFKINN